MNQDNSTISDEMLCAFLDEQLDASERDRVLAAINADVAVNQRMAELRLLRDMVQHAYDEPPQPQQHATMPFSRTRLMSRWAVAACLVLSIGVIVGWFGHQGVMKQEQVAQARVTTPVALSNVILHLTSADPERISAALDEAEQMLVAYKQQNKNLHLEIIANDGGLNLMRSGVSSFQPRIQQLKHDYGNVEFLACAKAINRLKERGVDVELLPEVKVAPSALSQIIQRMQENWRYIKA